MKIKNKIVSSLVLATVLSSGLYAANCDMTKKNDMRKNCDSSKCMMNKKDFDRKSFKGQMGILGMFKKLNLTDTQKEQIQKIVMDSRKNRKSVNEAFTKDGFDKAKYIQIMNEKRENMLKSKAEIIEKSYNVLTSKQKEQLKVLMDLRKEKMQQRFQDKNKG